MKVKSRRNDLQCGWPGRICLLLLQLQLLRFPGSWAFVRIGRAPFIIRREQSHFFLSKGASAESDNQPEGQAQENPSTTLLTEQVNQLRESVDIVSVIESYSLPSFKRKSDASALAICPFHDDNTPSMSIDNNRKIFKCFACGEGGDIFKFVRSYSALQGKTMTFYESVRNVAQNWGDPNAFISLSSRENPRLPRETDEQRKARQHTRNRLLLCHAAAADFYGKALIHLPAAGQARSYLRLRGLSPATVQTFALGYAPEAYFAQSQSTKSSWGKGSLVNHLQSMGFSAAEIVESGLATKTKQAFINDHVISESNTDESNTSSQEYVNLMDRFRGRIIVPIFDDRGENVIAFGARILPSLGVSTQDAPTDFKPPKYLNSPETPVFSKKRELFGLHTAVGAITKDRDSRSRESIRRIQGTIVVVEGYMDAIALWEAGIQEVVASMGTSLTSEQLDKAAKGTGTTGGRIIFCLDNDDAGMAAVERLCSSPILSKLCEKHLVEVLVATLPDGIKDPGEFFEAKIGDGDAFRSRVLNCATEWSKWFTDRIVSGYDSSAIQGSPSSFAGICERVSAFLATFTNPADRTRRSYEAAVSMARVISSDSNSSSNALQIQLESDLVNMVARKAALREAVERRVESVEGYGSPQNNIAITKRLFEGGASALSIDESKLARNATKKSEMGYKVFTPHRYDEQQEKKDRSSPRSSMPNEKGSRTSMTRRIFRKEPLIPHFTGIQIRKPADADWLGVSGEKSRRESPQLTFGGPSFNSQKRQELVYFDSNDFHGDQFLTEDAINAGYRRGHKMKDADAALLEKGIGVLIAVDHEKKAKLAEEVLLRNLVWYPSARSAMSAAVSTSDATGASPEIDWSTKERGWLFRILVSQNEEVSDEVNDPESLWRLLSNRSDTPVGAFGSNLVGHKVLSDVAASRVVANAFPRPGNATRYGTVDANIALLPENDYMTSSMTMVSDHQSIDEWSASYDPTLFNNIDTPRDFDTILDDLPASSETVIDAKLTDINDLDKPGQNDPSLGGLKGTLDRFFVKEEDVFAHTYDTSVKRSFRAELEVQEALANLLRASAATKLSNVNSNWLLASRLLDARIGGVDVDDADVTSGIKDLDSMNIGDLQLYCESLLTRLQQLHSTVSQLDVSANRISIRLMEYSRGDATEGRISVAKQELIFKEIDEFVNELPDDYEPPETDSDLMDPLYVLSLFDQTGDSKKGHEGAPPAAFEPTKYNKVVEDAQFYREMELIDQSWGEMTDDDYIWSMPNENSPSSDRAMPDYVGVETNVEDEIEEPLEDAILRIDEEWGDWDVDPSNIRTSTLLLEGDLIQGEEHNESRLNRSRPPSVEDVDPDSQWE